jgi:hypothetical protein
LSEAEDKKWFLAAYVLREDRVTQVMFIFARSEKEILDLYPRLLILREPPPWLTSPSGGGLARVYDIDDDPPGELLKMIRDGTV